MLFVLSLILGSVEIPFMRIVDYAKGAPLKQEWVTIIHEFRLPKALTGLMAGAGLAVSGLQMQTIFRNPMAGPYVLGISSGASLGVALFLMGFSAFALQIDLLGDIAMAGAAWIGALLVLILILFLSFRLKNVVTILILGMMFGAGINAVVNILQYLSQDAQVKSFVVWTMGSLAHVTLNQLHFLVPVLATGLAMAFASVKMLNLFLLGENQARSLGLHVNRARIVVFVSTSLLAGTITAFCGPIGFLGIAAPHIARMLFRSADHRILLPGSALIGAIALLLSDLIAQMPGYEQNLPLNSITALIGIPVVIWVIFKNQKFGQV